MSPAGIALQTTAVAGGTATPLILTSAVLASMCQRRLGVCATAPPNSHVIQGMYAAVVEKSPKGCEWPGQESGDSTGQCCQEPVLTSRS